MKKVNPKPLGKVSVLRKVLSVLPHHCSYCSKKYVPCHSNEINVIMPLPKNGYCCPDGHEGYVKEFTGFATIVHEFDFVKNPPKEEI